MSGWFLKWVGRVLAKFLQKPTRGYRRFTVSDPRTLQAVLRPGDVLLVEGNLRCSAILRYVTQSTWTHAALFVGDAARSRQLGSGPVMLVEADLLRGVVCVPLTKYADFNTRICRPLRLSDADRGRVVQHVLDRVGNTYDLKNVVDLFRYLLPRILTPAPRRRRRLALGSGDPTRAICSSLVAQAFHAVHYPILPNVRMGRAHRTDRSANTEREILHIRHHSLFTPSDFDLSPYFRVVKPTIERGFDYKRLHWYGEPEDGGA